VHYVTGSPLLQENRLLSCSLYRANCPSFLRALFEIQENFLFSGVHVYRPAGLAMDRQPTHEIPSNICRLNVIETS
jgi:hypothetical protein